MEHLTAEEMIDFISMTKLDEKSLKNASVVTGHITECETCLRKVRAFQVIYDEFVKMGSKANSRLIISEMIESQKAERTGISENVDVEKDR